MDHFLEPGDGSCSRGSSSSLEQTAHCTSPQQITHPTPQQTTHPTPQQTTHPTPQQPQPLVIGQTNGGSLHEKEDQDEDDEEGDEEEVEEVEEEEEEEDEDDDEEDEEEECNEDNDAGGEEEGSEVQSVSGEATEDSAPYSVGGSGGGEEYEDQQEHCSNGHHSGEESSSSQGQREVKRRKVNYEEKSIEDAVNWLNQNGGTVSDAAKRFNIPRSTLRFRLKSTDPIGTRKSGAPPALSPEEEQLVVDWVLETARMGQPPSWKRLSIAVKEMLDRSGHTKVFANNNMPSSGWLRAFKKRHPNLSPTKSDEVSVPDTLTKEDIKKWFIELQTHLKEEGLDPKVFLQPQNGNRIYNSEEVVVMLQGEDRLSKVLTQKGKRNVPKFCSPGRKMITVMTCISAAGSYLRPFIVFEGRKIPLQQLQQQVDPTLFDVGFSKRGGIDHELFSVWVEGLISYLDYHNIQRPVLLLLDSHTCHINLNTCEMAKEAGLIMHLLPLHANHLMQPVDVGIFKTLKTAYRDSVDHFMPTHGPAINKKHFPLVFVNAWHGAAIKENAINGFREAGLVPLNLEMIDTTRIPARPRPSAAAMKAFKERAPGRPLHKGGRPPKRTPRPPGNDYIRGLSDALDHIIHNFVSDKVRPIYEQWILEEKSCTPDPVFYIWGSLKTLIEENTKKQIKCEQVTTGQQSINCRDSGMTSHSPLVDPPQSHPPSIFSNHKETTVGVLADHIHIPASSATTVPTPADQHQRPHPVPPTPAVKEQTRCVYERRDQQSPHSQPATTAYTPQNMTVATPVPSQVMSWDHSTMQVQQQQQQHFNRYFGQQPPHGLLQQPPVTHEGSLPTASRDMNAMHRTTVTAPPETQPVMVAHHAGSYYANRTKDMAEKDINPMISKTGIKRQWLDDKEDLENSKRRMVNVSPQAEKNSRAAGVEDACNVYDTTDSSNYSARIGMCMQEVVPQDICQLQYQDE